jgi:hypothetical protein
VSLGYSVGPAAGRNVASSLSPDFKDGLKDIILGGIGVATTFGLQALQNKLNVQQQAPVIYTQQGAGQYQVPGVYAPAPVDYSRVITIGVLVLGGLLLVKAFKG